MKAIVLDQFGGPEVLQLRDMPLPEPGPGEVRIAVYAAGVNPVDAKVRQGALYNRPQGQVKHTMPLILGWDAAGIIDAVGSYTSHFSVGEAVFVRPDIRRNGAYAEYLVVEENLVAPMPSNLSFVEAASLPLVGLTAWQALLEAGGLQEGWKVFIHGGSGGVGSLAIQLAKAYGAWVSTNASRDNLDFVRSLGADEALDYASDEESAYHGSFDLVLDTRGGEAGRNSYQMLRPEGILVSLISKPDEQLMEKFEVQAHYVFMQPNGEQLAAIGRLAEQGLIRPQVSQVLPLEQARKAHEQIETGHTRGKIVLRVRRTEIEQESRREPEDSHEGYGIRIIINEGPTIKTRSRLSCVSRFVFYVLPNYYPTTKSTKYKL